jgi:hypothetical protein
MARVATQVGTQAVAAARRVQRIMTDRGGAGVYIEMQESEAPHAEVPRKRDWLQVLAREPADLFAPSEIRGRRTQGPGRAWPAGDSPGGLVAGWLGVVTMAVVGGLSWAYYQGQTVAVAVTVLNYAGLSECAVEETFDGSYSGYFEPAFLALPTGNANEAFFTISFAFGTPVADVADTILQRGAGSGAQLAGPDAAWMEAYDEFIIVAVEPARRIYQYQLKVYRCCRQSGPRGAPLLNLVVAWALSPEDAVASLRADTCIAENTGYMNDRALLSTPVSTFNLYQYVCSNFYYVRNTDDYTNASVSNNHDQLGVGHGCMGRNPGPPSCALDVPCPHPPRPGPGCNPCARTVCHGEVDGVREVVARAVSSGLGHAVFPRVCLARRQQSSYTVLALSVSAVQLTFFVLKLVFAALRRLQA